MDCGKEWKYSVLSQFPNCSSARMSEKVLSQAPSYLGGVKSGSRSTVKQTSDKRWPNTEA